MSHVCILSKGFDFDVLNVADLVTEVDPDFVDRTAVLGERFGVAFCADLRQSLFRAAVQLEFHDVYVVLCLENQINPSAAGMVFHLYVEPHQLENDVKNVLVTRHDFFHETLDLVGRLADAHGSVVGQQEPEEPLFHLPVGEAQRVVLKHPVIPLDGQVTALVDDGDGIRGSRVDVVQYRLTGDDVLQFLDRVVVQFEQLDQIRRRSRFKPVAAEFFLRKGVQQAERIVHAGCVFREMITVVIGFQFLAGFFVTYPRGRGQFVDVFLKIRVHFLFTDTADFGIMVIHGYVHQIIQVAENTDLAELGDPRQQGESDTSVHGLQGAVESFQHTAVFILQGLVADGLKHGFVVFVNEDHDPSPRLFAGPADNALET